MRERLLAGIIWIVVSLWSRTITVRVIGRTIPHPGQKAIYAFWHGSLFLLFHQNRKTGIVIPASDSKDGEIMARLLKHFGLGVVRGSSSRHGHQALMGLIRSLQKGTPVALAVDGPRGPVHKVKNGAAYLAGLLNVPVIPVVTAAKRSWILQKTWEKLALPIPFTQGVILYGEPVHIGGTSPDDIEKGSRIIEQTLRTMTLKAQEITGAVERDRNEHPVYGHLASEPTKKG